MIPLAEIVDPSQLLRVIATALVAGIGISLVFSLVILGAVRAGEHRAASRHVAASVHAVLATLALLACLGAIAWGVTIMLSK
ncbi:MAG TPA: hypothetical protein VE972_01735 [Conexibacter sp.]|nr:hypothetical protein [Conexibacter sp.]